MTRYHLNGKGEPGRCQAFSQSTCPYDATSDHYDSKEDARRAYEDSRASFHTVPQNDSVKITRRNAQDLAATSTDPAVLFEVAQHANRKIAKTLAANPAATADVLREARSQTRPAYHEFVELEMHENYPPNALTGEGIGERYRRFGVEGLTALGVDDGIIDDQFYSLDATNAKAVAIEALKNPRNKLSSKVIAYAANNDNDYAIAAAESGRFPSDADLSGKTIVTHRDKVDRRSDGWAMQERAVREEAFITAAAHNPNQDRLRNIYRHFRNTAEAVGAVKAIFANPHASRELKREIAQDIRSFVDEVNALASATE